MWRPRRTTGIVIAAAVGALAVLGAGAYTLAHDEQPVAQYRDLASARADGAVARGWLPAFLPPSSRDLREVHDLDTGGRWLTFRADSGELAAMAATLAPL